VTENFHIIAFTHRNLDIRDIGLLTIEEDKQEARLTDLKSKLGLDELMFLSTCNRVEFVFCTEKAIDFQFLIEFFNTLYPQFTRDEIGHFAHRGDIFNGINAIEHMLAVASSIDSMVVGEREIITQVRHAFETSKKFDLTGDFIRLVMRHTIETAKRVYTETSIATKPVSVVSLAYHKLRDMNIPLDARIMIIGAGVTNTNMSRFLKKHGFKKFVVFNRTLSKAEDLAKDLSGTALPLQELSTYQGGFDVIIACTGADTHLITPEIYATLLIAEALFEFKHIQKVRSVELAMRDVPEKVKEIKTTAMNEVFKNDLASLDDHSKEVLEKIIGYMEKKYMSMPMLMAKEILLKQ